MTPNNRIPGMLPFVTAAGLAVIAISVAAWALTPPTVAGQNRARHAATGAGASASAPSPLVILAAAAPADTVERARMEKRMKTRGWAGLELARDTNGSVRIARVISGSPAEGAGLRDGDLLVSIAGVNLAADRHHRSPADLSDGLAPGQRVRYTIERDGKSKSVRLTLSRIPARVLAGWIERETSSDKHAPSIASI